MNTLYEILRSQMGRNIQLLPDKKGRTQVMLPIYYEDGDMVDIYTEPRGDNKTLISDCGMTLMKLSYYYEINTDNKSRILNQIIASNGLDYENGIISKIVDNTKLYPALISFGNTLMKVSTMTYFKREMIKNLFYEMMDEVVTQLFDPDFSVKKQYSPIEGKDEYLVDYCLLAPRPVFIYAVKDTAKARLVTISAQEFKLNKIRSNSIVVYEDFLSIQQSDQKKILNATVKQFPTLDDFSAGGLDYVKDLSASNYY
ncbi:MAG: DUF1828 domain-containing protein [Candidatus Cloacimonetes bacterium]|nr:DUF1828 domain-containing protein [Candidatus Cloacimonadota bacterium]